MANNGAPVSGLEPVWLSFPKYDRRWMLAWFRKSGEMSRSTGERTEVCWLPDRACIKTAGAPLMSSLSLSTICSTLLTFEAT